MSLQWLLYVRSFPPRDSIVGEIGLPSAFDYSDDFDWHMIRALTLVGKELVRAQRWSGIRQFNVGGFWFSLAVARCAWLND